MHLVLDQPVLVEVVKDVAPMMTGGFLYPFSEFCHAQGGARETARLSGRSQRPRVKEARGLMAAGGLSKTAINDLDYMVRDIAIFKLWSQAIQAMLRDAPEYPVQSCARSSNRCGLKTAASRAFRPGDRSRRGGPLVDPSDYFNAWYGKDGPQNYSFWDNKEFQGPCRLGSTVRSDPAKRLALISAGPKPSWNRTPPLLPIALGKDQR